MKDEIEVLKTQKAEAERLAAEREEQGNNFQSRVCIFLNFRRNHLSDGSTKVRALEENLIKHKEQNTKNTEGFRKRLGAVNSEKSELSATISELKDEIKKLIAERDSSRAISAPDASQQLSAQLETLRQEKAALEQTLAKEREERATMAQAPVEGSADQAALIVSFYCQTEFYHLSRSSRLP